jgi:muconolactone delta-isomerase
MKFLVTGVWVELGAAMGPEQLLPVLEQAVIPSLEMLRSWEEQRKLVGGVIAGERETAFVLDAASSDEVGQLLTSLPFWGMMKWSVRPLQSMQAAVGRERALLERVKGMAQGAR